MDSSIYIYKKTKVEKWLENGFDRSNTKVKQVRFDWSRIRVVNKMSQRAVGVQNRIIFAGQKRAGQKRINFGPDNSAF